MAFASLEAYDSGELVASAVDGAEFYEFQISGPVSGTRSFRSVAPSVQFDLDEDPGTLILGTVTAVSAFARSASATIQQSVRRSATDPSSITSWGPTIEILAGGTTSLTTTKKVRQTVSVQKHSFAARRFAADATFTVAPDASGESVVISSANATLAHSGLYRLLWKVGSRIVGARQFYYRVMSPRPPVPLELSALDNARNDLFSGFQFVGLSKATDDTFSKLNNWFNGDEFKNFNLEVECCPVTFYHPLRPENNGFENTVHPMDAVHRLIDSVYPGKKELRRGKLRVEVDLFFARFVIIERRVRNEAWEEIGIRYPEQAGDTADGLDITDSGHLDGIWLEYRLTAGNSAGCSRPSEPVSVWVPARAPVPKNLTLAKSPGGHPLLSGKPDEQVCCPLSP